MKETVEYRLDFKPLGEEEWSNAFNGSLLFDYLQDAIQAFKSKEGAFRKRLVLVITTEREMKL